MTTAQELVQKVREVAHAVAFQSGTGSLEWKALDCLRRVAQLIEAVGITGGLHAMITRPDRSHVLEQARQPILFIVGQLDEAVPPDLSAAQLALPRVASIHVLPKVSHMGMFEARRPTQLVVRQFVDFCLNFAA